jgi:hypothetical protein
MESDNPIRGYGEIINKAINYIGDLQDCAYKTVELYSTVISVM